jgi:hypothetical protein
MRKLKLIAFILLIASCAQPAVAQEQGSPFNLHIGGGIGTPLNPTANFAGVSGAFQVGGGPNITTHNSIVGEFMWQGLPGNRTALQALSNLTCVGVNPLVTTTGNSCGLNTSRNLYVLSANYMYHREHNRFGWYGIVGGGWYYRYGSLKNATVAPGTVCEPVWDWWGFTCVNGLVSTNNTIVSKGQSSGGVNAGFGLTVKLSDAESGTVKFYIEARYHYSPQGGRVSTQVVPVMMGIRW